MIYLAVMKVKTRISIAYYYSLLLIIIPPLRAVLGFLGCVK